MCFVPIVYELSTQWNRICINLAKFVSLFDKTLMILVLHFDLGFLQIKFDVCSQCEKILFVFRLSKVICVCALNCVGISDSGWKPLVIRPCYYYCALLYHYFVYKHTIWLYDIFVNISHITIKGFHIRTTWLYSFSALSENSGFCFAIFFPWHFAWQPNGNYRNNNLIVILCYILTI